MTETAEQERFRIFALTHKKPTQAADEWLADRKKLAALREAAKAGMELLYCFNPLTGKRDGNYCGWEGKGKCQKCTTADKLKALLQESSDE